MPPSLRLDKAWRRLCADEIEQLPGQLGVYEISDDREQITYIGYAGGHSAFGLRSALDSWQGREGARWFRVEVTMQYLTRHRELLMVFQADHGRLPELNDEDPAALGRLRLG